MLMEVSRTGHILVNAKQEWFRSGEMFVNSAVICFGSAIKSNVASYADIIWARHAISSPPPQKKKNVRDEPKESLRWRLRQMLP